MTPLIGYKVQTVPTLDQRDFTQEAVLARKPNMEGVVVSCHDSHGICFDVRHSDGTIGTYDLDELTFFIPLDEMLTLPIPDDPSPVEEKPLTVLDRILQD